MKYFIVILLISEATVVRCLTCDNVTDRHWILFLESAEYTNYIKFDEITRNGSYISDYMDNIIQLSYQKFRNPKFIYNLDFGYEDPVYDFLELFSWSGKKLPIRDSQLKSTMVIHDQQRLSSLQKDESHFLVFVVIDSIDMLDTYLHGPSRKPFHKTRGRYIVAVREIYSEKFHTKVGSILRRMWMDYGLYRVIVMSTCQDEYFYQFDPFISRSHSLYTEEGPIDMDIWGEVQISYFNDSIALERWSHAFPFTYNGYPMTSVMFPRLPTVMLWEELPKPFVNSYFCDARPYSKEFGGVDGLILGNLIKALNFTPYVFQPVNEYGYQLDNGTYIGSIGDVLYSKAGFSSNGRFVQDYGTSEIEFLYPIFFDKFCVISPKALQIPQWLAVFRCFDPNVWTLFISSTTALGLVWYSFRKWTAYLHIKKYLLKRTNEIISPKHDTVTVAIIDMWLIMTSGVPSLLPYHSVERLFITSCLLLSLIFGGTFQGSLTTSYSTKSYYADIHTLKDLDESGLLIGSSSRNLENIFESEGNPVFDSLNRKFTIRKQPAIDQTAFKRDICCIERASDINVIITTAYELADGSALLHVVEECPRSYHLSFIVRKGWPFLTRFNDIIMRLSEGGFLFKWYEQVEQAIILSARIMRLKDLKDSLQAFTLEDMQTAFYLLSLGLLICTLIFLLELYIGRKLVNKKNKKIKSKLNHNHVPIIRVKKVISIN